MPPQSTSVSVPFLTPSVQAGAAQTLTVQTPLAQSVRAAAGLPGGAGRRTCRRSPRRSRRRSSRTRGAPLVLIGETPTQYDRYAQMAIRASSGALITAVADLIAPGP